MSKRRRFGALARSVAGATARRLVKRREVADRELGLALVEHLDEMKGMAMKVGQILSYLDGAMPEETQVVLRKLQKGAEPVDVSVIEGVIRESLGAELDALFERFDREPVAAASIGQVHRAQFAGQEVAVKVRYPDIEQTFQDDMQQLHRIARIASLASRVDGAAIVEELRTRILEECDYAQEARWQAAFAAAFADDPDVVVPNVLPQRSTLEVLTTEWVDGRDFYAFIDQADAEERARAARVLLRFAWRSVWVRGAIQADPHPGNYVFLDDGRVCFLDFGCVKMFDEMFLQAHEGVARAVLRNDRVGFEEAVRNTGMVASRRFDFEHWWRLMRWQYRPYTEPRFHFTTEYVREGMDYSGPTNVNMMRVQVPPDWIWFARLQAGLHAVAARLDAEGSFGPLFEEALDAPRDRLRRPR